jgi:hypothetical protein
MSGFRNQKWDPRLIISQIIAVQTLYYFGLGFWVFFITFAINQVPTLDYIFSYDVRLNKKFSLFLFRFIDITIIKLEWTIIYWGIFTQCFNKVCKKKRISK